MGWISSGMLYMDITQGVFKIYLFLMRGLILIMFLLHRRNLLQYCLVVTLAECMINKVHF